MAGATDAQITQRDLHGVIRSIYRSAGWLVVELHENRANPRQQSGPDFIALRDGEKAAMKGLLKGDLSNPQEKVRAEYVAAGFDYRLYYPADFVRIATDAERST